MGSTLFNLRANDGDGDGIMYRIIGEGSHFLFLNERNGVVSLARPLSDAIQDRIEINVGAYDDGYPVKNSSTNAKVIVNINKNRESPVFKENQYTVTITEKTGVNSNILRVQARDNDNQVRRFICGNLHYF